MKPAIQYKNVSGSGIVKDVDLKTGTVTGYFSAFGNVDSDGDVIMPGAYTKTLIENGRGGTNRIKHLLQHNVDHILGVPSVLKEDPFGLYYETTIVKTDFGLNTLLLYEAGAYNEHSVGFKTIKESNKGSHNELQELKLWEGSTVTWGSNPNTPATGMKSMKITPDKFNAKLDGLLKGIKAGTFAGENSYLLVLAFKEIKDYFGDYANSDSSATVAIPDEDDILNPLKSNSQAADALDPEQVMIALNELKKLIA